MSEMIRQFLPELKKYHGVYVAPPTYEGTCAFLSGYELGSGQNFLKQFHIWLAARKNGRVELFWPFLVLCEVYRDDALPDMRYLTPEQDGEMVSLLFRLLEEFFNGENDPGA
ncbi:hypothetical protein ACFQ8C_29300 [Streptomyces sp. NPDC056503]|uniref:hypothetical protein n=1 Tax=Streptomyces sp. NPDC056503 TaxID=3345842 RepID=UPI00368DF4B4